MSHICECAKPPGGFVQCGDHQLAICYPDGSGGADKRCIDPPSKAGRKELQNWALGHITGISREPNQAVTAIEERMLRSGEYRSPQGMVRFSLPRTM
jgi:hypothetical protein